MILERKSAGIDGVDAEVVKEWGELGLSLLLKMCMKAEKRVVCNIGWSGAV